MASERLKLRISLEYLVIVPSGWSQRPQLRISPEYLVVVVPGSWSERLQLRIPEEYLVIVVPTLFIFFSRASQEWGRSMMGGPWRTPRIPSLRQLE